MLKKDILDYIMNTPHNSNPAVLDGMLNSLMDKEVTPKTEIELVAYENKVYTPATGKVYNKVTVDVPQDFDMYTFQLTCSADELISGELFMTFPYYDAENEQIKIYSESPINGVESQYAVPVGMNGAIITFLNGNLDKYKVTLIGNVNPTTNNNFFILSGDGGIDIKPKA